MKIDDSFKKKAIISTAIIGSFGVLYGGQKSITKSLNKLQNEFMQNIKPEYFYYLDSSEFVSVSKLLNKGLTEKDLNMFAKIWKIPDKKRFATEALDILVENSNCQKLKPKLSFELKDEDGSWNTMEFNINVSNVENTSKVQILNTIMHEFTHYKQLISMLCAENVGANKIINFYKNKFFQFLKDYDNYKDMDENILFDLVNKSYEDESKLLQLREDMARLLFGVTPVNSPEAKKADEYFNALKNYVSVNRCSSSDDVEKYIKNALEKGAFEEGDAFSDKYSDFILELALGKNKH